MGSLIYQPAWKLAELIWKGKCSSTEVVKAHLERIERLNPEINAVVTLDAESALARAGKADAALARGELWGPLHGVPMTLKDAYNTEGMRTTNGFPHMRRHVPLKDATLVHRLKSSGAIILGKTNLPLYSFDWQCKNPIFGRTNNPWNLDVTPGGSSGGSAAAISAGLSALELGSDVAGSLRVPAHFCGVSSLRPTEGWVSDAGVHEVTGFPKLTWSLATCGPIAANVRDLKLAMTILAGSDRNRWQVPPISWPEQKESVGLRGIRIAYRETLGGVPICSETKRVFRDFISKLWDAGCAIYEDQPRDIDFEHALLVWGEIEGHYFGVGLPAVLRTLPFRWLVSMGLLPYFLGRNAMTRGLARSCRLGNRGFYEALTERGRLVALMDRFFDRYDLFLCPAAPTPAFTHRRTGKALEVDGQRISYGRALGMYNCPSALTGNPIAVIPIGMSEKNLPIGIQIMAGRWRDPRLLDLAERMETLVGRPFHAIPETRTTPASNNAVVVA